MKRHGHLSDRLVSWPNLLGASYKAARGKRTRDNVARFLFDYERELLRLQEELTQRTYETGKYRTFTIHEPKTRLISAAPFRDDVVVASDMDYDACLRSGMQATGRPAEELGIWPVP